MIIFSIAFFNLEDVKEICGAAGTTFVRKVWVFREVNAEDYPAEEQEQCEESLGGSGDSDDLDPYDPKIYGCGEITEEIEELVQDRVDLCKPLEEIFGSMTQNIKRGMQYPKEETECVAIRVTKNAILEELEEAPDTIIDQKLLNTCAEICYWCCCESLKKVSPIISEATFNLLN